MKKRVVCLTILVMLLILGGCEKKEVQEEEHDHQQNVVIDLRIGLSSNADGPHYKAAEQFAKEIEAKSNGKIKATVFGSGRLGTDEELIDSIAQDGNAVDIVIANVSDFTKYAPKLDISTMPFLFKDVEMAEQFMKGEIQKEAEWELTNYNMKVLAYYSDGFHYLTMTQKMINNASELQGMTIATAEESISATAIRAMGAMTMVQDSGDLSRGLQQGRFDGYEGTLDSIYHNRLYQFQKYLLMTNHSYQASAFVIDSNVLGGLDPEYQDIIMDAALSSSYVNRQLVQQQEREMLDDMQAIGVRICYPQLDTFWEKAQSVVRGYSSKYDSLSERLVLWKNEQ